EDVPGPFTEGELLALVRAGDDDELEGAHERSPRVGAGRAGGFAGRYAAGLSLEIAGGRESSPGRKKVSPGGPAGPGAPPLGPFPFPLLGGRSSGRSIRQPPASRRNSIGRLVSLPPFSKMTTPRALSPLTLRSFNRAPLRRTI